MTGRVFDRFDVLAELSRRGQISTLKCTDPDGKLVVLKVFEAPSESDKARIRSRAVAIGSLDHEGLAKARGVVESSESLALIYDWVDGETVASLIERGVRFTDAELFECMRQVLEALDHAHTRTPPVIHRDLKPQNIIWTGTRFVVIDFDSAREVFADSGNASVVGTTGYAGPEQFVGGSEPRSDQYGLAATVLHMATHQHPTDFPLAGLRVDLTKTMLSIPMRRVLDRMLDPQADRRFDSAAVALEAVATEDGLEPWQVAIEPLNGIDGAVTVERRDDELHIEIASRTSARRWMLHATACAMMAPAYLLLSVLPQLIKDPFFAVFSLPLTMLVFIFAIYFGSRARQEYRSRIAATIAVTDEGWTLERPGSAPLEGRGAMEIRNAGHSAAASTGGVTPISIRESLVVKSGPSEIRFGVGLLPIEATAIVDAVRAFQGSAEDEVMFANQAADDDVAEFAEEVVPSIHDVRR